MQFAIVQNQLSKENIYFFMKILNVLFLNGTESHESYNWVIETPN